MLRGSSLVYTYIFFPRRVSFFGASWSCNYWQLALFPRNLEPCSHVQDVPQASDAVRVCIFCPGGNRSSTAYLEQSYSRTQSPAIFSDIPKMMAVVFPRMKGQLSRKSAVY